MSIRKRGVFSAGSGKFGPVILKINQYKSQLESEYQMLARLSGHHSCKVYAFDEGAGLLLEERIFRGRYCAGKRLWKKESRQVE